MGIHRTGLPLHCCKQEQVYRDVPSVINIEFGSQRPRGLPTGRVRARVRLGRTRRSRGRHHTTIHSRTSCCSNCYRCTNGSHSLSGFLSCKRGLLGVHKEILVLRLNRGVRVRMGTEVRTHSVSALPYSFLGHSDRGTIYTENPSSTAKD